MIGDMRERLYIQRKTLTPDGIGGTTTSWANIAMVWAKAEGKIVKGVETMVEGRMAATFINVFTMYSRNFTELDRIMWNNEPWNIRGVRRIGNKSLFVEVSAERGVAS